MNGKRILYFLGGAVAVILGLVLYVRYDLLRYPERLPAVPHELTLKAEIAGIPNARYLVGADLDPMVREVLAAREREIAFLERSGHKGELPPAAFLAISGGGDGGAFGAGLLNAWTALGTRPSFKVVTGVSTGALIAPFAFIGAKYDPVLTEVYTKIKPQDIAEHRSMFAAVGNDGMADNRPLWALISKYIDQPMLDEVAAQYANGRLLLIGTTNLDARQPVIWNMGAIASSKSPNALELFRTILLASAAIPGAFPPTMFKVEVDGVQYEEMHVDGGASAQVFLYPPGLKYAVAAAGQSLERQATVYVIRNAPLTTSWQPVDRQTIGIAGGAISSLIQTQGLGDLYRIYVTTQRDGIDFNLASIGSDFTYKGKTEEFDTAYMQALYAYGYESAKGGYKWRKLPPGIENPYWR